MGATGFYDTAEASTMQEAFDRLCERARIQAGDDPYNGTISTCDGYSIKKIAGMSEKYCAKNVKAADRACSEECDKLGKRECVGIDLGTVKFSVFSYKTERVGASAVYKTKYCVFDGSGRMYSSSATQKEADAAAAKYFASVHKNYEIRKMPVLESGSAVTKKFICVKKEYTSRPKNAKGIVKEIHRYAFYGMAAE